jgi:hypothetical protein
VLATTIAAIVAAIGLVATVGADSRWLGALGHVIVHTGSIPSGIPFAAAPSGHWANALVLAELIFDGLEHAFGDRGLMLAQLLCIGVGMTVVARDAIAGGADAAGTRRALILTALGALPALVIVRVQMFSILLFPILVALLRADARRPSRRIWLVVPLLALWSNLHGAALLGLGVVFAYLVLVKFRQDRRTALALALAAPAALCLTPALLSTPGYYHGLLTNVAAQRGDGMWGPLSLSAPLDLLLVACAATLALWVRRARPARWELAVAVVLVIAAVTADRNGVWLLLFLAPISSRGTSSRRRWGSLVPVAALSSILALGVAFARGPVPHGAGKSLLAHAITLAHGSPILASDGIDEQVAAAGARIWAGNPIDAFSRSAQSQYLDFVAGSAGGRVPLADGVNVVLVTRGSAAARMMSGTPTFVQDGGARGVSMYVRRTVQGS